MNREQYDIDNDDNLFAFDPCEVDDPSARRPSPPRSFGAAEALSNAETMPSHDAPFTSGERNRQPMLAPSALDKGKGTALPMPIRSSATLHDIFGVSPPQTQ